MAGESGSESTSEEVTSMAPKLLSSSHSPGKVIPIDSPVLPQHPAFLYSHVKITEELCSDINKKWDACWPINMLRPLVLLDLISYLLFIKKLEEKQLITGNPSESSRNLTDTRENDEFKLEQF